MLNNADMPAFPSPICTNDPYTGEEIGGCWAGLTKREYATIKLLQGILANPRSVDLLTNREAVEEALAMTGEVFDQLDSIGGLAK